MQEERAKNAHYSKMDEDLFKYLPSEIILNILSRLPARTIMICKCVCKPWLELLVTREFVKSHHSNSAPGLVTCGWITHSKSHKIIEFVDDVESRWNVVFDFDLPFDGLYTSANGLLLHKGNKSHSDDIFISNPITREYITLPSPQPACFEESYGFGVSRVSGQYKVVRIFREKQWKSDRFDCQVHTVGSGSWRSISSDDQVKFKTPIGAFLNGNIHWLANKGSSPQVSCLDLETECFSTFSPPPYHELTNYKTLSILGDRLCVCEAFDDGWPKGGIDIWLMKEYGEETSWTKESVICKFDINKFIGYFRPIKVFKDGDILMQLENRTLLYYSSMTETTRVIDPSGVDRIVCHTVTYAPTFLPLKTFAMENVSSF